MSSLDETDGHGSLLGRDTERVAHVRKVEQHARLDTAVPYQYVDHESEKHGGRTTLLTECEEGVSDVGGRADASRDGEAGGREARSRHDMFRAFLEVIRREGADEDSEQ